MIFTQEVEIVDLGPLVRKLPKLPNELGTWIETCDNFDSRILDGFTAVPKKLITADNEYALAAAKLFSGAFAELEAITSTYTGTEDLGPPRTLTSAAAYGAVVDTTEVIKVGGMLRHIDTGMIYKSFRDAELVADGSGHWNGNHNSLPTIPTESTDFIAAELAEYTHKRLFYVSAAKFLLHDNRENGSPDPGEVSVIATMQIVTWIFIVGRPL